jgi:hypothetical protein
VRTSFVAVEKPGQPGQPPQWGLRKASDVSSVVGVNGNIEDTSLRKISSRNNTMAADQTAREDLGLILKGSPFEGDQTAHTRQTKDLDQPISANTQKKIPEIDTKQNAPSQEKVTPVAPEIKSPTATKSKPSIETSKAPVKAVATKAIAPKTADRSPISPHTPQSAKVNTTHPVASIKGIRGGPAKIMAVMDSANKARVEREKKSPVEAKHSQPEKKEISKPSTTNNIKKAPASPKAEKALKAAIPPARQPAVATAPPATSATRIDGPPKSLNADNRRGSAVRRDKPPPKVANTSTTSSLAKKTSRSSLAPQTNGHERPKSRVSTAKDESFLARMMRPTASSQLKVHEKVVKPESPPRVRKVSDKIRQSLGTKMDEDEENEEEAALHATKSIPEVKEQKMEMPAGSAVAQEAA